MARAQPTLFGFKVPAAGRKAHRNNKTLRRGPIRVGRSRLTSISHEPEIIVCAVTPRRSFVEPRAGQPAGDRILRGLPEASLPAGAAPLWPDADGTARRRTEVLSSRQESARLEKVFSSLGQMN